MKFLYFSVLVLFFFACTGNSHLDKYAEKAPLTPGEQFDAFVDSTIRMQELQKFLINESNEIFSNAVNDIDEEYKGAARVVLGKKISDLRIVTSEKGDGTINSIVGLGSGLFSFFMDQEKLDKAEKMLEPELNYLKSIKDYHDSCRDMEKLFYLQIRELLLDNPSHFDSTTSSKLIATIEAFYFQDQSQKSTVQTGDENSSIISSLIKAYIDGGDPMHDRNPHSRCHTCVGAGEIVVAWGENRAVWDVCQDCNGTGYGRKY